MRLRQVPFGQHPVSSRYKPRCTRCGTCFSGFGKLQIAGRVVCGFAVQYQQRLDCTGAHRDDLRSAKCARALTAARSFRRFGCTRSWCRHCQEHALKTCPRACSQAGLRRTDDNRAKHHGSRGGPQRARPANAQCCASVAPPTFEFKTESPLPIRGRKPQCARTLQGQAMIRHGSRSAMALIDYIQATGIGQIAFRRIVQSV